MILTWLMYALGQGMHLIAQLDTITRASNNTATSRLGILKDRWIPIMVRAFLGTLVFGVLLGGGLPKLLALVGMSVPASVATLAMLLSEAGLVGAMLAGAAGFGADSALAFFPPLKSYIPPPIDQEQAAQVKGFVKGVDAAKQAVEEVKPPIVPVTLPPKGDT